MNLFKPLIGLPEDDDILLIDTATDTGHQVSATTHLAFALTKKKRVILLDTYYYSPETKHEKKRLANYLRTITKMAEERLSKHTKAGRYGSDRLCRRCVRNQL